MRIERDETYSARPGTGRVIEQQSAYGVVAQRPV